MKNNGSNIINLVIALFIIIAVCAKYISLKEAYKKAEHEKHEYCIKYHEQLERIDCFVYEIQSKDSLINRLEIDRWIYSE